MNFSGKMSMATVFMLLFCTPLLFIFHVYRIEPKIQRSPRLFNERKEWTNAPVKINEIE